jgi:hypothetical protein
VVARKRVTCRPGNFEPANAALRTWVITRALRRVPLAYQIFSCAILFRHRKPPKAQSISLEPDGISERREVPEFNSRRLEPADRFLFLSALAVLPSCVSLGAGRFDLSDSKK